MLAENINAFIKFIHKNHQKNSFQLNTDKLYQIKLLIEEFKFQIIADELLRINRFDWDERYTYLLVGQFKIGLDIIEEYVKNYDDELFLLTARLHTLSVLTKEWNTQKR